MFSYILLAWALIILLCAIYYFAKKYSRRRKRNRICKNQQSSNGTFDEPARAALRELATIDDPNVDDRFTRATIIHRNVVAGHDRREFARVVADDYTVVLAGIAEAEEIDQDFILHQIEDFHGQYAAGNPGFANFTNAVGTIPETRNKIAHDRRERAVANAATQVEAITMALDDATKYTNDPQNVHDHTVNNELRKTLHKLKSTYRGDEETCFKEAYNYIDGPYRREFPEKATRARTTLDRIRHGEHISTYNDTESNIFAYTWDRANHPANRDNKKLMHEAIANAMADSVENNGLVCVNGRTSRMLNSLVTLDHDESVGSAMTFGAYRNQIFQDVKAIIKREIDKGKKSEDDWTVAAATAYEAGGSSNDADADVVFKDDIKKEITAHVDSFADKLNEKERSDIKNECHVYAAVAD